VVLAVLRFLLDLGPFIHSLLVYAFTELTDCVRDSSYLLEDLIHYHISDVNQHFEQLALLAYLVHLNLNLVAIYVDAF